MYSTDDVWPKRLKVNLDTNHISAARLSSSTFALDPYDAQVILDSRWSGVTSSPAKAVRQVASLRRKDRRAMRFRPS